MVKIMKKSIKISIIKNLPLKILKTGFLTTIHFSHYIDKIKF